MNWFRAFYLYRNRHAIPGFLNSILFWSLGLMILVLSLFVLIKLTMEELESCEAALKVNSGNYYLTGKLVKHEDGYKCGKLFFKDGSEYSSWPLSEYIEHNHGWKEYKEYYKVTKKVLLNLIAKQKSCNENSNSKELCYNADYNEWLVALESWYLKKNGFKNPKRFGCNNFNAETRVCHHLYIYENSNSESQYYKSIKFDRAYR